MDTEKVRSQFYACLGELSREYGMKYSKNSFCAYQRLGEVFWKASFLCGFFLREGQLEVTAVSQVKPLAFDETVFPIIDPEKKPRITDVTRATASFAPRGLLLGETVHRLPCGDPAQIEEEARTVLKKTVEERDAFLSSQALAGGLPAYLMDQWEKHPYEAGLASLCAGDYAAAQRSFALAGESGRYEQLSIGRPGRYLYLVFMDYCKAVKAGIPWTDALAVNGFSG